MALVDKEFVMPGIGVWILAEVCMIYKKLESWEQPQEPENTEE